MFRTIKAKLRDAGTIRKLCERAEAHALRDQQQRPGAEHFLLAALDLDDTARLAFEKAGAFPDELPGAIERQYTDALSSVGLSIDVIGRTAESAAASASPGVYSTSASGQEVMQELAKMRRHHSPLLAVHIVAIVAGMPHGVAARALRNMGVDLQTLRSAAEAIAREQTVG